MNANANAATVAPAPALMRRAGPLDTMVALAKRELWEHRSLWIAPLVVLVVLAACVMFGNIHGDIPREALTSQDRVAIMSLVQFATAVLLFFVASIVVTFYLLDCLFAERKDRSILFWKSLPLSDAMTVGSKFLVAAVVVPLGALLLAAFGSLVLAGIGAIRIPGALSWDIGVWLRVEWALLRFALVGVLWYAPISAALLLLSAWARRSPILWASLLTFVTPAIERIGLGTHHIWSFELYRANGIWHTLWTGHEPRFDNPQGLPSVDSVLNLINYRAAFTEVDLWIGVIAAIALTYAAIRVRRYRDDT